MVKSDSAPIINNLDNWEGSLAGWLDSFDQWKLSHEAGVDNTYQFILIPQAVDWGLPARVVRYLGRALRIDRLHRFRWGFEYHGRVALEPYPGGVLLRGVGEIERRRISQ